MIRLKRSEGDSMKKNNLIFVIVNAYQSQQTRHAIKTALAAIITIVVYQFFDLPKGYWAVITTIIIMQSNIDSGSLEVTLKFSLQRIIGTVSGAIVGFSMLFLIDPTYLELLVIIFLVIFLGSFLVKVYSGFNLTGPTAAIILLLAHHEPFTKNIAFIRSVEIVLGVVIATLVTLFIWPYRVNDHLNNHRKKILCLISSQFAGLIPVCNEKIIENAWYKRQEKLITLVRKEKKYIKLLKKEQRTNQENRFNMDMRLVKFLSRLGETLPQLPKHYYQFPLLKTNTRSLITMLRKATKNLIKKNPKLKTFKKMTVYKYVKVFENFRAARRQSKDYNSIKEAYQIFTTSQALQECSEIIKTMYEELIQQQ